jgi:hypothetical protein
MNDATHAQQEFIKELRDRLEQWQVDAERLNARAEHVLKGKQAHFEGKLEKLQSKHAVDAVELRQINEQVWQDLSAGLEQARQALQEALEQADSGFE